MTDADRAAATRALVTSGDGTTDLGLGWLVGRVPVYFFAVQDNLGHIQSFQYAEDKPGLWARLVMWLQGKHFVSWPDSPKIVLDTGGVVYGCQVWWTCVEDTSDE